MINYDTQTTFTDSSGTPKTITSVGQAHHIGNPKIGSTSIRLDSNDYLTVPVTDNLISQLADAIAARDPHSADAPILVNLFIVNSFC